VEAELRRFLAEYESRVAYSLNKYKLVGEAFAE
jgi:hypothetical protein